MERIVTYDEEHLENVKDALEFFIDEDVEESVEKTKYHSGGPGLRPDILDTYDISIDVIFDFFIDDAYEVRKPELSRIGSLRNKFRNDEEKVQPNLINESAECDYYARLPIGIDLPHKEKLSELNADLIYVSLEDRDYESLSDAINDLDNSVKLTLEFENDNYSEVLKMTYNSAEEFWEITEYRGNDSKCQKVIEDTILSNEADIRQKEDVELGKYRSNWIETSTN